MSDKSDTGADRTLAWPVKENMTDSVVPVHVQMFTVIVVNIERIEAGS